MNDLIYTQSPKLSYSGVEIDNPHSLTIPDGVTAIVGPNGSGKSTLGRILEKGWNFGGNSIASASGEAIKVKMVEFNDIHSLANLKIEYYQQRYEATASEEVPTVAEVIARTAAQSQLPDNSNNMRLDMLLHMLDLIGREEEHINQLSSGELRKLLILNAIINPIDLLILDNPYIGLDNKSRAAVDDAISKLAEAGTGILLLTANPRDIPDFATCVVPMRDLKAYRPITEIPSMSRLRNSLGEFFDFAVDIDAIPPAPVKTEAFQSLISLNNVSVAYDNRIILKDLSWEVKDGQFWALAGPNGSGKSTLLSLICADNPKAYCNNITLFDRPRGTGETIWDIKRRIGYISPELTLQSRPSGDVLTIVAQGLNDTMGNYVKPTPPQIELARKWLGIMHLSHLADRPFFSLSTGERQMAMLARVFIKQPRLMVLDEPFHGLDCARIKAVRAIINNFAAKALAQPAKHPMALIFVSHNQEEIPECVSFTKTL